MVRRVYGPFFPEGIPTCVPRQRWTPRASDQPIFDQRAQNLVEEYR
ncbi:MAG: hypothetical protein SNJ72_02855 [Fimbriimonadales bacterium]